LIAGSSELGKRKVYLVGAGPGDPDLLTVKAVRVLGLADVVLHDALVSAEVLALIGPSAQIIDVGKRCGRKRITQDQITSLLLQFALSGEVVVRLKSGDPLIFGRAGEELDALQRAGVDVEIVPGVSAAMAAAATSRVSLTDRRKADQVLFISAHRGHGKEDSGWEALVTNRTTVVVYMPGDCAGVAARLRGAGLSESTPCAIVSRVTSKEEQSYQTTLGKLHCAPILPSPCVLIVGETLSIAKRPELRSFRLPEAPFQEDFPRPSGSIEF